MRQQTFSNKLALLNAVEQIKRGKDPWGYVFEDDITLNEHSNASIRDIIRSERNTKHFQYLGVCLPQGQEIKRTSCGRCAHAMGFSKQGANELLEFSEIRSAVKPRDRGETIIPAQEPYLDVIVDHWCQHSGGFTIAGLLTKSAKSAVEGHVNIFIQDRGEFQSVISNARQE